MKVLVPSVLTTISVMGVQSARTLDGPHKAHTHHMQLCIPDATDIAECTGKQDGEMLEWDEYGYFMSDTEYGSAVLSPDSDNQLYLKTLVSKTSSEGSDEMWQPEGSVEENGVTYKKFVLRPADVASLGNEENVLLETGALPDRLEYLETEEGAPYTLRQYSGVNGDTMYFETMFMMAERLTDEEMGRDPREMAMDMAIEMTGGSWLPYEGEDPIPTPRSLRSSPFASQSTMPGYYHRNENWMFWNEFSEGSYPQAAISSFQVAQKSPQSVNDGGSQSDIIMGDIVGITTYVDRAGKPGFQRQVADASDVRTSRVDLESDEWIVQLSGRWYNGAFTEIVFVSNKGRSFEFISSGSSTAANHAKSFTWSAEEDEALYGIRAYVEEIMSGTYLRDMKALWGPAPEAGNRRLSVQTTSKANLAANQHLRGSRRGQEVETETSLQRFKLEFPPACVESERDGKCLSVFQEETRSVQNRFRIESVSTNLYFRYRRGPRHAELEGLIQTGDRGDIEQLQITGRGCVTPGEFRVGRLARVSATKCFFGDIAWRGDRTITGQVGFSFTLTKEVKGRGFSIELAGQGGVRSQTRGRTVRFAGYTGEASITASFAVVAVGATGNFEHYPNDIESQDDWVTDISITPEISVNLFFFKSSASTTFQIVQIGPESRQETEDRFPPGAPPYPDVDHLEFGDYITDVAGRDRAGTHVEEFNTNIRTGEFTVPETPASAIEVTHIIGATRRARSASRYNGHRDEIFSIHTINKAREGKPAFSHRLGQQAQAGFRRVDVRTNPRVTLDEDEWFVKVAGYWANSGRSIWQLRLETNKGRVLDYAKDSDPPSSITNFEFEAPTGYALYSFDGYVERESSRAGGFVSIRTDRVQDLQVAWGMAPEIGCNLPGADSELCIPKLVSTEELRCTGWPETTDFTTDEERCLLANEQLDDGFQYVYNYDRFTGDDVEPQCGRGATCWCCRRRVRET